MSTDRGFAGAAGEYAVAAELSRRGWLAMLTLSNSPDTDVLARHVDSGRLIALQVKTVRPGRKPFQLSTRKHEAPGSEGNDWFAFVRLGAMEQPASEVAGALRRDAREMIERLSRPEDLELVTRLRRFAWAEQSVRTEALAAHPVYSNANERVAVVLASPTIGAGPFVTTETAARPSSRRSLSRTGST